MNEINRTEMFSNFIKSIIRLKGNQLDTFCANLFNCFPVKNKVTTTTTHNWILGRNEGFSKCIPHTVIKTEHYSAFVKYLRKKISLGFGITKQDLYPYASYFEYVDFDADNPDIFFCSLLKQFLHIIDIPVDNNPILDVFIATIKEQILSEELSNIKDLHNYMKFKFSIALSEYKIPFYINNLKLILNSLYPYQTEIQECLYDTYSKNGLEHFSIFHSDYELFTPVKKEFYHTTADTENFHKRVRNFQYSINESILVALSYYSNEKTYLLINEFCNALDSFSSITSTDESIAEEFSKLWHSNNVEDLIILCNKKCKENKQELEEIHKKEITKETESSLSTLQKRSINLSLFSTVLSNHTKICSIYEQLFDGKSILQKE